MKNQDWTKCKKDFLPENKPETPSLTEISKLLKIYMS